MRMKWKVSHRCDPAGRALADRHYSRQSIGAKNFVQPGKTFVLVHEADYLEGADAVWVTTWPFAEYVRHAWAGPHPTDLTRAIPTRLKKDGSFFCDTETPGTWNNALFRNESKILSSDLILQAVAATLAHWGPAPSMGMVTMVWSDKVRSKRDIGRAYLAAGFTHVGQTAAHDKDVFLLSPENMPVPRFAIGDAKRAEQVSTVIRTASSGEGQIQPLRSALLAVPA